MMTMTQIMITIPAPTAANTKTLQKSNIIFIDETAVGPTGAFINQHVLYILSNTTND